MKRWIKNQRGDTILEVLIAVAVLSLILTTTFVLANRSSQANRQAAERSEAYKLAQGEMEILKTKPKEISESVNPGEYFCFTDTGALIVLNGEPAGADDVTLEGFYDQFNEGERAAECRGGLGDLYATYIYRGSIADDLENTYTAYSKWFAVTGNGVDQASLVHRFYPDTPDIILGQNNDPLLNPSPNPVVPEACPSGQSGNPPNCLAILNPSISPASRTYPAWHLLANVGAPQPAQQFTITNPAGSGVLRVSSVSLSGAHANLFRIVSNDCSNRQLSASQSCSVRVEFYPPQANLQNRQSNAGLKNAQLNVTFLDGKSPRTAALSGRTYSDRMVSGDILRMGEQLKTFSYTCYNNADTCRGNLVLQSEDTNLVFYIDGIFRWCTCLGSEPAGTQAYVAMQPDGHLVVYRQNGSVVWKSDERIGGAYQPGDYLVIHDTSFYPAPFNNPNYLMNLYRANGNPYYNFAPVGAFYP